MRAMATKDKRTEQLFSLIRNGAQLNVWDQIELVWRLPACVEVCSTKALQLVDYDNPTAAQKALIAKAQIINKDAGTSPKIRFISSITDFGAMKVKA